VSKLKSGDLVTIEPWDCEGIEQPWGWLPDDPPPKKNDKISKKMRKFKKIKLNPNVMGIIIARGYTGEDDYDEHYTVIVEGRQMSVPIRFLHSTDQ